MPDRHLEREQQMSAKKIFGMTNGYTQWATQDGGICTCISLWWAQKTLKKGHGLSSFSELPGAHVMNAQMAMLRKYDSQPDKQTELVDGLALNPPGELPATSVEEVVEKVKNVYPHVAIFWTSTHTMGYRYAHHEKEFFDVEIGLFRAKLTKDILAKMNEITSGPGYGPILGLRHVKLDTQ
jgi:hypothetical protein